MNLLLKLIPYFETRIKSLHWLKVNERIEYKLLSVTYKVVATSQPMYLFKSVSVQFPRSTRSSSVVTISRPPTSSSLKITNRYFQHAAPHLWNNKFPHSFREPYPSWSFTSPPAEVSRRIHTVIITMFTTIHSFSFSL